MAADSSVLTSVVGAISAIGGLGVAAAGLVDGTKAFAGGISNVGLKKIERALSPFGPALVNAQTNWMDGVRASWINGVPKDDQKAAAKSLIRLGLSSQNAEGLAKAGHVDAATLTTAMVAVEKGQALTPDQINVLGRLNGAIDAAMDGAFEQADQEYRNASKFCSGIFAVILAVWGGAILNAPKMDFWTYVFHSPDFGKALIVGLIAVPLAPVVKDLTSSIQAAVTAVKS
jgi:hypothetical protein